MPSSSVAACNIMINVLSDSNRPFSGNGRWTIGQTWTDVDLATDMASQSPSPLQQHSFIHLFIHAAVRLVIRPPANHRIAVLVFIVANASLHVFIWAFAQPRSRRRATSRALSSVAAEEQRSHTQISVQIGRRVLVRNGIRAGHTWRG